MWVVGLYLGNLAWSLEAKRSDEAEPARASVPAPVGDADPAKMGEALQELGRRAGLNPDHVDRVVVVVPTVSAGDRGRCAPSLQAVFPNADQREVTVPVAALAGLSGEPSTQSLPMHALVCESIPGGVALSVCSMEQGWASVRKVVQAVGHVGGIMFASAVVKAIAREQAPDASRGIVDRALAAELGECLAREPDDTRKRLRRHTKEGTLDPVLCSFGPRGWTCRASHLLRVWDSTCGKALEHAREEVLEGCREAGIKAAEMWQLPVLIVGDPTSYWPVQATVSKWLQGTPFAESSQFPLPLSGGCCGLAHAAVSIACEQVQVLQQAPLTVSAVVHHLGAEGNQQEMEITLLQQGTPIADCRRPDFGQCPAPLRGDRELGTRIALVLRHADGECESRIVELPGATDSGDAEGACLDWYLAVTLDAAGRLELVAEEHGTGMGCHHPLGTIAPAESPR